MRATLWFCIIRFPFSGAVTYRAGLFNRGIHACSRPSIICPFAWHGALTQTGLAQTVIDGIDGRRPAHALARIV